MTINRKTIEEILKLREQEEEITDWGIAAKLGFDIKELDEFECFLLDAVQEQIDNGTTKIEEIAEKLDLPPEYILHFSEEYELETTIGKTPASRIKELREILLRKRNKRSAKIKKALASSVAKAISEEDDEPSTELLGADEVYPKLDKMVFSGKSLETIAAKYNWRVDKLEGYYKKSGQYKLWEECYGTEKLGKKATGIEKPRAKRRPDLDTMISQGFTLTEMATAIGKCHQGVRQYINLSGQHDSWRTAREQRKEAEKIARQAEKKQSKIKIPKIKQKCQRRGFKRIVRPEVDELIKQGATSEQLRLAGGWNHRENARQYMITRGVFDSWKAERQKIKKAARTNAEKQSQEEEEEIATISRIIFTELYRRENNAGKKVLEYLYCKKGKRIKPPEESRLREFYTEYFRARDAGEKKSLEELGKHGRFSFVAAGKLLSDVNLEPLHGKKERHITPDWKKQAIKRAFDIKIGYGDIAYFLDLPMHVVQQNMERIGERKRVPVIAEIPREGKTGTLKLTYRLASQIYEARDCGFSNSEIAYLLNAKQKAIIYTFEHESDISPKIVETLRILHKNNKIEKPYIQKADKNREPKN